MKKILTVLGIIILIVPTVFAVLFYREAIMEERSKERLLSVTVISPEGVEYLYSVDSQSGVDKNMITLFRSLASLTEKSDKTPEMLTSEGKTFTVKYTTTHGERLANIYAVHKESSYLAYFNAGNGTYCLDEATREKFLSYEFSYSVYEYSNVPNVLIDGKEINSHMSEWTVKMSNGKSFVKNADNFSAPHELGEINGLPSISFEEEPDSVLLTIKDGETTVYEGDLFGYKELKLEKTGHLEFSLKAVWYQSADSLCFGNAYYYFNATGTADPNFKLSSSEMLPGEVILLSCLNIPEGLEVSANITPALSEVKLYRDSTSLYSFIPAPRDASAGSYTLEIKYGAKTEKIYFGVGSKKFYDSTPFGTNLIPTERVESALSDSAVAEYKSLLASVAATESDTLYYDGMLSDYQQLFSLYKGYGFLLQYSGSDKTTRNDGVLFTARTGSVMSAMGAGKVCAVGECAYLGKYIVVDHGYGLRSWYVCLSETLLLLGDEVKMGDSIAKSGATGIGLNGKMLVMITVNDIPVSPYQFWETDRKFG